MSANDSRLLSAPAAPTPFSPRPPAELARLAATLPDAPRWVEARGMLLAGRCEVADRGDGYVVASTQAPLAVVVGAAAASDVRAAAARAGGATTVLCAPTDASAVAAALPERRAQEARLHLLDPAAPALRPRAGAVVRLLADGDLPLLAGLPDPELRAELALALAEGTIAASFVGGPRGSGARPVAFCYAAWETESLWDVAVNTLAEHRRRGLASSCFAMVHAVLAARGKQPVWGALAGNLASLRMAARLGFRPVDDLVVFAPSREPGGGPEE